MQQILEMVKLQQELNDSTNGTGWEDGITKNGKIIDWKKISSAFFELTTDNEQGEYYLTDIIDWSVKKEIKTSVFTIKKYIKHKEDR